MAIVLTGFPSNFVRVPFLKPPDMVRMQTAIPRAVVWFVTTLGVLPAKPLNDQQKIQFSTLLPLTFAYRMIGANINVQQDNTDDWNVNGECKISNSMRGQPLGTNTNHGMESQNGSTFAAITGNRNYFFAPTTMPTFILQSIAPNTQAGCDFRFGNDAAAAGGAGVVNFWAYFYEYDIEQVQMFPPLVPALTYALS